KEALDRYSKACEMKNGGGCFNLGAMQYNGEGVTRNEKQAIENFKKGCKLGAKGACDILKQLKIKA
ncbi:sel1 repeat family protein, partial [Flagellimonas olearia]